MRLPLLTAATLPLLLLGCVEDPDTSSTAGLSWADFRAQVYQEPGTGLFIVDWDRPIRGEEALFDFWAQLQERGALAIYNNGQDVKWNATQKKNLTYCVSNNFGAQKQAVVDAMRQASDEGWEVMADVNFIYVSAQDANCTAGNTQVLFDVNPVNSGGQYLARAFFPDSPRGDRNVLIDTTAFDPNQTGGISLRNILGHELGHTLGFRHEHIRPEANAAECVEDNQYRGVTPYDSASVMHYPQCNGTSATLAFTTRDREGVVAVYGAPNTNVAPMAQLTSPTNGATVTRNFTVTSSIVDTDIVRVELYIDEELYQTSTTAPYTFQVSMLEIGAHDLRISATDAANQTTSTEITIMVTSGGGGGGGGGGTGDDNDDQSPEDLVGGCSASGGGGAGALVLALALIGLVTRRRAR